MCLFVSCLLLCLLWRELITCSLGRDLNLAGAQAGPSGKGSQTARLALVGTIPEEYMRPRNVG